VIHRGALVTADQKAPLMADSAMIFEPVVRIELRVHGADELCALSRGAKLEAMRGNERR